MCVVLSVKPAYSAGALAGLRSPNCCGSAINLDPGYSNSSYILLTVILQDCLGYSWPFVFPREFLGSAYQKQTNKQ